MFLFSWTKRSLSNLSLIQELEVVVLNLDLEVRSPFLILPTARDSAQ